MSAYFETGEAAVLALRAGVDVLLFCLDFGKAADAFEALAAAVEREPAPRGHVERSNRRIAALKERHLRSFTGAAEDDLVERLGKLANRKGE